MATPKTTALPMLENISIVGKFSDGKVRQILIAKTTADKILQLIVHEENSVRILDKDLQSIDIEILK